MKTTKKQIETNTRGRAISMSNQKNYTYQIGMNENYTKDTDENVLHNIGSASHRIGYAHTKREFIDIVFAHMNNQ